MIDICSYPILIELPLLITAITVGAAAISRPAPFAAGSKQGNGSLDVRMSKSWSWDSIIVLGHSFPDGDHCVQVGLLKLPRVYIVACRTVV